MSRIALNTRGSDIPRPSIVSLIKESLAFWNLGESATTSADRLEDKKEKHKRMRMVFFMTKLLNNDKR